MISAVLWIQISLARIKYTSNLKDAVRGADLVIESAPEVLDIKRELSTELGSLAAKEAIVVTNRLHAAAQ
jgi:3-hydroxybutyryl-CoA dehydrogenase